jgi:hypothetical protein
MKIIILLSLILISCSEIQNRPDPIPEITKDEITKLCLTGDTGTGEEGQFLVAKAMMRENCKRILIAGDIIYNWGLGNSGYERDLEEKFLKPYHELIHSGAIFYLIAGNHDHYRKEEVWYETLHLKYPFIFYPDRNWVHRINDICIFAFDPYKLSDVNKVRALYPDIIPKMEGCKLKLSMSHYPYYSGGKHGDAIGSKKKLIEDIILGNFDFYLAGHDHHLEYAGKIKETHLIVSGAGGKLRPIRPDKVRVWAQSVLGFAVLEFDGKKANVKFKNISNEVIYEVGE